MQTPKEKLNSFFTKLFGIETIENENGTVVKFPKGIMIAFTRIVIENYNDTLKCLEAVWTFPEPFKHIPVVNIQVGGGNAQLYTSLANTDLKKSNIQVKCQGVLSASEYINGGVRNADCFAIGKWK